MMPISPFKLNTTDPLIPVQGVGFGSKTSTTQTVDPLIPLRGKIVPPLDAALRKVSEPIESFQAKTQKALSFLKPRTEEEALGQGLAPIKRSDGTMQYIDVFGAATSKKLGKETINVIAKQKIVQGSVSALKEGVNRILSRLPGKERIIEVGQDAVNQLVDRFAPLKRLTDKAIKLTVDSNPYIAARNFAGHFGKIQNRLDALGDILRPVREELPDLVEMAKLERFEELASRGITKFEDGMKAVEITPKKTELFAKLGKEKVLRLGQTLSNLRGYTNELLTKAKDGGIISEASFQAIVKNNQKYIPLQRLAYLAEQADNIPRGRNAFNVVKQDLIKAIKGSEKEIANPLESIVRNTYRTINLVERNKVALKVADLAVLPEFSDIVKPLKGAVESGFDKISVFRNGIKEEYTVPVEIADVMKGLNERGADIMTRMASLSSRALRAGATSLNIPFLASNAIRDFQTATVASRVGFTPTDWLRGFSSVVKQDDLYRKYLESGASFSGFFESSRSLASTVKQISQRKLLKNAKTILNPIALLRAAAEKVELAPRIGVFNRALKKGLSETEAAFISREATVDFAKSGSTMKVFNQWVPFLNARLQGAINLFKAVGNRPVRSGAILTGMVGIPLISTYIHNSQNFPEIWNDIAQFEKDNNFVIIFGDGKDKDGNPTDVIKIPKGDVGRTFGNPLENFLAWMDNKAPKSLTELATQIFSDVSPISFEREGKLSLGALAGSILPPTIKGMVESVTGMNLFTGRQIVPERLQKASPELQFKETTSPALIMAGRFLNVSPLLLENFIGTQFGGLGRQLSDIGQAPETIKRRFFGATGRELERQDYKLLNEIEQGVIDKNVTNRSKAEKLYTQLKDIPLKQRNGLIRELFSRQEIDIGIVDELGKVLDRELSSLTNFEESIKNKPVEVRAKFIVEKLQKLPVEDRRRMILEWAEKKIITEKVTEEIEKEIQKIGAPEQERSEQ